MPRSRVCLAGHADGARHVLDRIDGIPSNERSVRASAVDAARIDPHFESRSGGPLTAAPIRPRCIAGPHPLPSRQFQALFDSLFKVLFIFPSRYLFAIGLSPPSASLPAISSTL
ncbi:unnamed protein product [Musa banksii]